MKNTRWLLISFLGLIFLNNCKEKPEPIDPCKDKTATNADFIIEQQVGERWFEGDTVISSQFNKVRFTAKHDADSYLWKIGSETITTKSFIRTLFPENSSVSIKLIVSQEPSTQCFPNDDGKDTVEKKLLVWHNIYGSNPARTPDDITLSPYIPLYGTYYGESSSEVGNKKFVTIIDTVWTNENSDPKRVGLIRGIPYKSLTTEKIRNASLFTYIEDFGFRSVHFNMKTNVGGVMDYPLIPRIVGYAWLDRSDLNMITIDYQYLDTLTNNWKQDTFTGKRVW